MIVIQIPVKIHVKKYLQKRYGAIHQVSYKSFLGLVLLQLLEKKVEKPNKDNENTNFYDIKIPELYFKTKGFHIDKMKLKYLGICLERLFMEDLYSFVDHELLKPNSNAMKAIKLFYSIYELSEQDVKLESVYRNYQRYSGERIKNKKQCKAIV